MENLQLRTGTSNFSASGSHSGNPTSTDYRSLPRIGPPTRTPIIQGTSAPTSRNHRSGLSSNQSHSIHSPLRLKEGLTVDAPDSRPRISSRPSRSQKTATYQGSVFHTHFYNNGPESFSSSRTDRQTASGQQSTDSASVPMVYGSEMMFSVSEHLTPTQLNPNEGSYTSPSLAPAFVMGNSLTNSPARLNVQSPETQPTILAPNPRISYNVPLIESAWTQDMVRNLSLSYSLIHRNLRQSYFPPQLQNGLLLVPARDTHHHTPIPPHSPALDLCSSQDLINGCESGWDVLDPSRAPLKHLTDVLEDFKSQDGKYSGLLDTQEYENLLRCLLDEELAMTNPFQAAMGLVLLSKLGLHWEP
ncbi:hypothetical protein B0H34DRAFT_707397 [Crassisporium funariophilum]|nr:hypothetical protein B0H34DRAFT_707397 [Crassisporium funariophilum]